MRHFLNQTMMRTGVAVLLLAAAGYASAGSHLWRFNEIFSNADGTVQYMEMVEIDGSDNEFHLMGKSLHSNSNSYEFPNDLPPKTANRNFLVATQSYADLAGVAGPDYVIPDNFFDPVADSVVLHTYDKYTFTEGMLPDDGYHARDRMLEQDVPNSPTNFNGDTTVIDLSADIDADGHGSFLDNCTDVANFDQVDTDGDGIGNRCDPDVAPPQNDCMVDFLDVGVYKANFLQVGDLDTDNNGDGQTDFLDLVIVKAYFLEPPGPSSGGCN